MGRRSGRVWGNSGEGDQTLKASKLAASEQLFVSIKVLHWRYNHWPGTGDRDGVFLQRQDLR